MTSKSNSDGSNRPGSPDEGRAGTKSAEAQATAVERERAITARDVPLKSGSRLEQIANWLHTSPTIGRAANVWFLLFLFYVLVIPAGHNPVLIPAIGLTGGIGVVRLIVMRILGIPALNPRWLVLAFAAAGAIPVGVGAIYGTPGWTDVAVPLVAAPLVWFAISHAPDSWAASRILAVTAAATIVLTLIMVMLITGVGRPLVQIMQPNASGASNGGIARVALTGASTLIGTVPFLGVAVFDGLRRGIMLPYSGLIRVGFFFGLVGALLSGRQGVMGAVAATPLLVGAVILLGFTYASRVTLSRVTMIGFVVALIAAGLGIAALVGISPSRLPSDLIDAAGMGQESQNDRIRAGATVRSRQVTSLVNGWKEKPIFGNGAGAISPEFYTWRRFSIGDEFGITPRPWRAEMHYHLLLFEGGLVAVAAYGAAIGFALTRLRKRFRTLADPDRLLVRAALVAAGALILATAYNPLVRSVVGQLPLYLPMVLAALATSHTPVTDAVSATSTKTKRVEAAI